MENNNQKNKIIGLAKDIIFATASSFVIFIVIQIYDLLIFEKIERGYINLNEENLFDHLKSIFILGIIVIYFIFYFYSRNKKNDIFPRLNRKLGLIGIFISIIVLFVFGYMSFLFYHHPTGERFGSVKEFIETLEGDFIVTEDVLEKDFLVDYVVIKDNLSDFLITTQIHAEKERAFCLYGYRLIPALPIKKDTIYDIAVVEDFSETEIIESSRESLIYKPCADYLLGSEQIPLDYINIEKPAKQLSILGLIHSHPSKGQGITDPFLLGCELSRADKYEFSLEHIKERAWIWGVTCSNDKIFFYSEDHLTDPINLIIVEK